MNSSHFTIQRSSLDNIRGSAAKKRAEKMARGQDKSSGGSNRDLDDSGLFSLQSTGRLDFDDGAHNGAQTTYVKKKK